MPSEESTQHETFNGPNTLLSRIAFRKTIVTGFSLVTSNKDTLAGGAIVFVFAITAIVVYLAGIFHARVTPYDPLQQNVGTPLSAPSWEHIMGTDQLGRDVFSRIITATPNDFAVSLAVIAFALAVGTLVGTYAGFHGGFLDEALMRITDIFFAIPALVLAIAIGIALGPGLVNMTIALIAIWWPPYARLARGEALRIAHQNYIDAARLAGVGRLGILFEHVLPNIIMTLLIYASLDVGTVILVYSGLSYLGLSVRPPFPDWGAMVSSYEDFLLTAPWLPLFPALVIALGVIGFSLLGDGLRDTLESV
jgi:peptide/nickel transport system permease protein